MVGNRRLFTSFTNLYRKLIDNKETKLNILIYSGDNDAVCATKYTNQWIYGLGYLPISNWKGITEPNFTYAGTTHTAGSVPFSESAVVAHTASYLNVPYLWGGKSVFGIDCSGFSQQVFRYFGKKLPRDSGDQAKQGEDVGFLAETRAGDLAFFDNAEGTITHVGILLNNREIIHASGKVRIDTIDQWGIINRDTELRTHTLRIIKRYP